MHSRQILLPSRRQIQGWLLLAMVLLAINIAAALSPHLTSLAATLSLSLCGLAGVALLWDAIGLFRLPPLIERHCARGIAGQPLEPGAAGYPPHLCAPDPIRNSRRFNQRFSQRSTALPGQPATGANYPLNLSA